MNFDTIFVILFYHQNTIQWNLVDWTNPIIDNNVVFYFQNMQLYFCKLFPLLQIYVLFDLEKIFITTMLIKWYSKNYNKNIYFWIIIK